mgnify:CR=1 FL=1
MEKNKIIPNVNKVAVIYPAKVHYSMQKKNTHTNFLEFSSVCFLFFFFLFDIIFIIKKKKKKKKKRWIYFYQVRK